MYTQALFKVSGICVAGRVAIIEQWTSIIVERYLGKLLIMINNK